MQSVYYNKAIVRGDIFMCKKRSVFSLSVNYKGETQSKKTVD